MFQVTQKGVFTVVVIFLIATIIILPVVHEFIQNPYIQNRQEHTLRQVKEPVRTTPEKLTKPIYDQPTRLSTARIAQELPSYAQEDNHGETMYKEQAHDIAVFPTRIVPTQLPDPVQH